MVNNSPVVSPAGQDTVTVKRLRRGVGFIAVALPPVVLFGNMLFEWKWVLLGSISGSYYTHMRGVFSGSLCAIGVFLIAYRYQALDDKWSTRAGILAIIVALVPTTPDRSTGAVSRLQVWAGGVHFVAAASLFAVLAYFCLYIFTHSRDSDTKTPQKNVRTLIYLCTGGLIVAAILAALLIAVAVPRSVRDSWNTLFWCETAAVLSFAVAWLTKGGAFRRLNDPPRAPAAPPQQPRPGDLPVRP